ncbi:MAG: hypothetical protein QNJ09_07380 [Paracoccaceae bacterium]|nr:hypothetical protein [Paracoccaceae bacterium]
MASGNADIAWLADQLDQLPPGHLPQRLFEAVARLVVTPTLVVVPLFRRDGLTRVILTRRAADDRHYAGLLHPPGTVLLSTDESLAAAVARLFAAELPGLTRTTPPVLVTPVFDQIARGRELSLVHYAEVCDPGDAWPSYDACALPGDVIPTDVPRIELARIAYESRRLNPSSS